MIELRILGPLDLRAPDGTEVRSVLSQPKRLVLLAYLAVTPGAFRRRDTLLALFWPELDQPRARAALRQAVYHLRRALGAEVIVGRGDDELGIDPARLWCDAAAFRRAVAERRFRDAVELYRGDLLGGVYLEGALELERWIEEERARLRAAAAAAAWSVAEAVAAGRRPRDLADAAAWGRRAVELAPDDEASVRRLIALLARASDRAGALRVYQELARRLDREYRALPSPATQALIEQVRSARGVARAADGERAAVAGAGPASAAPRTLAVLPFAFRGRPDYDHLAEDVADLLEVDLAGTDAFRCVNARALRRWLAREDAGLSDAERIRAVGERFGAVYCVTGGIVQSGDRIRIHAALYAVASPDAPLARVVSEAGVSQVLALVDRLAAELLTHGVEAPTSALARAAARTTESLRALKEYLTGERAFRAGRYTPAAEAFQRAVIEDPGFALAHYRLATLAEWAGFPSRAEAAATRAVLHAERLPVNDRRLLEALRAYFEGNITRAELLYLEILGIDPDSVEAWFQLAKLRCFLNPLRGKRLAESREAWERTAALDPDNIVALVHQASVAAKERRPDEVAALSRRVLELLGRGAYTDFPLLVRVQWAFASEDREEQARLLGELEGANEFTLFWSLTVLTVVIGDLDAAGRVAGLMTHPSRPGPVRLFGRLARAELELAHGRWSRARQELDAAARLEAPAATVHRALLALVRFREPDPAELRALRDELRALPPREPEPDAALEPWFTAHVEVLGATRVYLLGLIHVHLGELEEAEARAAELDTLAAAATGLARAAHARDAARGIRALGACRRGDPAEALALLEGCELAAPMHCFIPTALYGRMHERWLRAELLGRFGRDGEAATWFAALGEDSPHGFVYLAPSHLRRAELLERRGEHHRARQHYARVVELWRDCDPEFEPLVASAAARLGGVAR